jgi:hypothetical protein
LWLKRRRALTSAAYKANGVVRIGAVGWGGGSPAALFDLYKASARVLINKKQTQARNNKRQPKLELELIQTQMARKPMLREEVKTRRELRCGWARDALDGWAGRGRVQRPKALGYDLN